MSDLLQAQIQQSCRLAIPEGLKDLMSDISREVLRSQPEDLYKFIADYLSALLVAREHLFIAARVCDDVCKNRCCEELDDELRELSLSEEDVQESLKIIAEYFSSGAVKEGNLLQKLMQKTSIGQKELPFVQEAIRRAFLRHQVNHTAPTDTPSTDSDMDETTRAANHTLKIYKKSTQQPDINYNCVASKIQAAYRAYNVRRKIARKYKEVPIAKRTETEKQKSSMEKVRFQVKAKHQKHALVADLVTENKCASKCSSDSLAGSFISLPPYKPYHIERTTITEQDEVCEKETEHATFDYLTNANSRSPKPCQKYNQETEIKKDEKGIIFQDLTKVVEVNYDDLIDEMDETDYMEQVDEVVSEEQVDEDVSEEQVVEDVSEELVDEVASEKQVNEVASEKQVNEVASKKQVNEVVSEKQVNEVASEKQVNEVASKKQFNEVVSEKQVNEVASEKQVNKLASEEQVTNEEIVIQISLHDDDFYDTIPIPMNLNKVDNTKKILDDESDELVQLTEMQDSTKHWNSDDSSVTTDEDMNRVVDINDDYVRDDNSEISQLNADAEGSVNESLEDVADDMDLMIDNQRNASNENSQE